MEAILDVLSNIGKAFGILIDWLEQGFVAITTFASLPGQATALLNSIAFIFPGYIWGSVFGMIGIIVVLRVWKIVTSGD